MPEPVAPLAAIQTATTTDQVFESLYNAMISFGLAPGAKVSEAEIARQLGVSRQPVRDAFYRLSQLGLLSIRPQRATLITKISERDVLQAAFIRAALETACIREAVRTASDADMAELDDILASQKAAIATDSRGEFHALDDYMHRRFAEISGHGYVWPLVLEQKAHIDRVRYLSLSFGQQAAYDQHVVLVEAMQARDPDRAEAHLRDHLSRIRTILPVVRDAHPQYFEEPAP